MNYIIDYEIEYYKITYIAPGGKKVEGPTFGTEEEAVKHVFDYNYAHPEVAVKMQKVMKAILY